ncbi:hypothetical protein BX666DRAFT_131724 [Dichotomocladium elegans]|nr:hypothetical protein BX666DRAFT_131724 [Dichotomocladium elegans]
MTTALKAVLCVSDTVRAFSSFFFFPYRFMSEKTLSSFKTCHASPSSTTSSLWPSMPAMFHPPKEPCFYWPINCTEQIFALSTADTTALPSTSVAMVPPLEPVMLPMPCKWPSILPRQPGGGPAALMTPELVTQEDTTVNYNDAGHPVIAHGLVNTAATPSTVWSTSSPSLAATEHLDMLTRDQLIERVLQLEYERRHCLSVSQAAITESSATLPTISAQIYHRCRWNTCRVKTKCLEELTEHIREVHIGYNKHVYYCEWDSCSRRDKPFFKRHKMQNHIRTHTGEKPFVCQFTDCNRRFSRLDSLQMHLNTHSSTKPFTCPENGCDKAYFHARSLRKHLKSHPTAAAAAAESKVD